MVLRVLTVPLRRARPPLDAAGAAEAAAITQRTVVTTALCLLSRSFHGHLGLHGFVGSTNRVPSALSCRTAARATCPRGSIEQILNYCPQFSACFYSFQRPPAGSRLPDYVPPQSPYCRSSRLTQRSIAAAATSSAIFLLAMATSSAMTQDATRVYSVPSFLSPVVVTCEARHHSTDAKNRGSCCGQTNSGATTAKQQPSNEDKRATAGSLKDYTWKFVNGSWLLKPIAPLLASTAIPPSKGSNHDAESASLEARKVAGDVAGTEVRSSQSAELKVGTEEANSSMALSSTVKDTVNELVTAIREKVAGTPAQSDQSSQKPLSITSNSAKKDREAPDSAETSISQPSLQPPARTLATTSVLRLAEELTHLLSRNLPDASELPSVSDLSPSKLMNAVQMSAVAAKIEELTEAIHSENAVATVSEYLFGHENILEVIKKKQSSEVLHPELRWDASVRTGRELSESERDFLTARKAVLRKSLRRYLDIPDAEEIHEDDLPIVAVSGSGGGYRAMVSMLGSLVALENSGLLDISAYIGCVSGSTWAVAQLYSIPTRSGAAAKKRSSSEPDVAARIETPSSSSPSKPTDPAVALAAGSSSMSENLSRLIDEVTNSIQYSPTSPQIALQLIRRMDPDFLFGGLVSKQSSGSVISMVDAFGILLSMRLMGSVATAMIEAAQEAHAAAAEDPNDRGGRRIPEGGKAQRDYRGNPGDLVDVRFGLSKQRKAIQSGERPMPIYSAVRHEQPGIEGGKVDRWELWEFSPYEIGCAEFGAFIPSWAFGRPFSAGRSISRLPESSLSLLLGMFGSAFCANAAQAYDEFRTLMPPTWAAQLDGIFAGFSSVTSIPLVTPSGWHNPFKGLEPSMLPERLPPHDPFRNRFSAKVENGELTADGTKENATTTKGGEDRPSDKGIVTDVVVVTSDGTHTEKRAPNLLQQTEDGDALCETDSVYLMDAGLLNNLSVPTLIRPERGVDVMLVIDSSSDIADHDYLERSAAYAKRLGRRVGIPEVPDWEGRGKVNVVVWEPPADSEASAAAGKDKTADRASTLAEVVMEGHRDSMIPDPGCTIVYVPLIKNDAYDRDFDPQTSDFCSTFNFVYRPEQTSKLLGLAKKNIEDAESSMKTAVRKAYEKRRRRRIEREQALLG